MWDEHDDHIMDERMICKDCKGKFWPTMYQEDVRVCDACYWQNP